MAWRPVTALATVATGLLVALAGVQDYHCDELYFRILGNHPSWGYPDQGALMPLVAKASITMFGDTVWGIRILPGLFIFPLALVLALLAREVGGGRSAQLLAALGTLTVFPLGSGHLVVTTTPDLLVWTLVLLFTMRALLRDQPRWWLAVGLVVGLGSYNKYLVVLLLVGLGGGVLLTGPRDQLRSGWLWAGVALAASLALPNLVYQVVNDFPQVDMANALAETDSQTQGNPRGRLMPTQLLLLGPLAAAVWFAGIWALLRWPELRPARMVAAAYGVLCVLLLVFAGQPYYTPGLLLTLYAVGCVAVIRWTSTARQANTARQTNTARRRTRLVLASGLIMVNTGLSAVLTFPPVADRDVATSPWTQANIVLVNQIGWPTYVRQVWQVYQTLTPTEQTAATIITAKSWTAGAIDRYGKRYDLPRPHSGHNGLYELGAPPQRATIAIVIGDFASADLLSTAFQRCEVRGRLDNLLGIENEDQGSPVRICREPVASWGQLWPRFRYVGL